MAYGKRLWAVLAALLVGCGGGGGGGSDPGVTPPPPPPPVVLTSLVVTPGVASAEIDAQLTLSATAHYSDGSSAAAGALWGSSDVSTVSLSSGVGTSVTATMLKEGTVTVSAFFGGTTSHATLTVTWTIPSDPGPIYGCDMYGNIFDYSAGSNVAVAGGKGFTMDKTGTALYCIAETLLQRVDLVTFSVTTVATLPMDGNGYFGLDYDAQGRIFAQGYGTGGAVQIYDPATGIVTTDGAIGGGVIDMAIGSDGEKYYPQIITSAGSPWIWKASGGTWATCPADAAGVSGYVLPSGIAINRLGETFLGDYAGSMYKFVDLNGDGDALDAGESSTFATFTAGTNIYGIALSKGRSLLVNAQPYSGGQVGVYWLKDLDGDGSTVGDAGEEELISGTFMDNGWDPGCIAAGR